MHLDKISNVRRRLRWGANYLKPKNEMFVYKTK